VSGSTFLHSSGRFGAERRAGVAGREDEAQQLVAKIVVYGHCYLPARLRASPEFLVAKLGLKIGLSSSCRG
jgi:hypothetical protein